ncbi:DNA topoisomerase (ATP-hydrolyzing) subunit B [Candidatus Margulisiibacteriota bacterium]
MTHNYNATEIKVLEGLEAVRKRPSMYIGSTSRAGLNHLVFEVVDNSVDEAMAGHCSVIEVIIGEDNIVTVTDDGRGIPIDEHKEKGIPAVDVVMTTLHAGGKFEGKGYKISGGLHGVGVSVVNALSEWLEVIVRRDGQEYKQKFLRGTPESQIGNFVPYEGEKTGTTVIFKPDDKIFEEVEFTSEIVSHRLKELAFLNKGLKIVFKDLRFETPTEKIFQYEGGIKSYVESITANKTPLFAPPIYLKKEREKYEVEVALQYVSDYYDEQVISFANNIRTKEGGTHLAGFRTALTRVINAFAKKYDLVKDKKTGFTGNDLKEGLTAVISIKLPNPQFEGQTKTKLGNAEIKGVVDSMTDEGLSDYIETHPKIGKQIINKALIAQRVREATRKAQDLARRKSSLESTTLPGKLADCSDNDPANCEVFIVEGDSAGGSAKQGRDRNIQAILPLRGKVLNVEKARMDKILANEEIRTLITAIGPGVISGLSTKEEEDTEEQVEEEEESLEDVLKKLRYHKIIIMTDADVDGAHIRTLLLTFFFRHARELIEAGALYIAQPPLYLVKKSGKKQYIYNDKQLNEYLEEIGKDGVAIQRYKGLGEMNPDQLWETTLDPEKRTLLQVAMEDAEEADEIFSTLMGSRVEPRKEFIEKYAKKVRWIDI